jgi:hypothetical protein
MNKVNLILSEEQFIPSRRRSSNKIQRDINGAEDAEYAGMCLQLVLRFPRMQVHMRHQLLSLLLRQCDPGDMVRLVIFRAKDTA